MPTTFALLVDRFIEIISLLVPVIFTLTIVVISWGVIKAWIINSGDEKSVAEGRNVAVVGVIALVFMVGIWALLAILQNSFGLNR